MYDRDVELLQFCAANLEPEQFLVHLLNKFGLVTWASQVTHSSQFKGTVDVNSNDSLLKVLHVAFTMVLFKPFSKTIDKDTLRVHSEY